MATGSSIGTMFTAFPIFYPAGVLLGADPAVLAGAIVSGAIFGDNLAPISDTTIISASTQRYRRRDGSADIGGVVTSRARYALVAALLAAVCYLALGGGSAGTTSVDLAEQSDPRGLVMLLPIAVLLLTAFASRNIFLAVTVALVVAVFGIMGVLRAAGVLDRIVPALTSSRLADTPRGAEAAIGLGVSATTVLFGGVNSAAMLTFGPVADEIGARQGLHPYRRTN